MFKFFKTEFFTIKMPIQRLKRKGQTEDELLVPFTTKDDLLYFEGVHFSTTKTYSESFVFIL